MRPLVLALLAGLVAGAAAAEERVGVRVGDHPGHGRVVFDWPHPPPYVAEAVEGALVLRFPAGSAFDLGAVRRPPRNVTGLSEADGSVRIATRPGVVPRHFRVGAKVVVDLPDPPAAPRAAPAEPAAPDRGAAPARRPAAERAARAPRGPAASAPPGQGVGPAALAPRAPQPVTEGVPAAASPPPASPTPAVAAAPLPEPGAGTGAAPTPPPSAAEAPRPAVEAPAPAPAPPAALPPRAAPVVRLAGQPGRERTILIPAPASGGAAVFRRGGSLLLVLDAPQPLDLGALRADPVFGALELDPLPNGLLLRLPLPPPATLAVARTPAGWQVAARLPEGAPEAPPPLRPIGLEVESGVAARLVLRAARPGGVVPLTDPETGLPLLVGTVQDAGQPLPVARRLPEFDLLATSLGIAVLARSDAVMLRAGADRFTLQAAAGARLALDAAAAAAPAASAMTRSFDLPGLIPAALFERLRQLQADIATAPPLARLPHRRAAAELLVALGLPQEAQAMLRVAQSEDPRAAQEPRFLGLGGAAALLAGRLAEAQALRQVALPDSDELTLWRSALAAAEGDARAAAPGLSATLPLLLDYPAPLRQRLLPTAAQALADAGALAPLRQLLASAGPLPELALPAATLAEAEGRPAEALAGYDRVAQGRDRQARARALRRAVELRLATGQLDPAAAARALDAAVFAWRGDAEEAALRLRVAALRGQGGDASGALALLRETEALFPDRAADIKAATAEAFLAALQQEPPLAAVALFDAYPDLLPGDSRGAAATLMLADRLAALDLGARAATVLGQAAGRATGAERARLGLSQGGLLLADSDPQGAVAALAASEAADLPEALARDRAVLGARAMARLGQHMAAVAALQELGDAGAEPLAELLVEAQDWPGAAAALDRHLQASLPPPPTAPDPAHQRLLLRQAAILVLAGDEAALARLRTDHAARLAGLPSAEPFALLTAEQLRGLADLPRLQRELEVFRNLPARLEALRAGGEVTR